MSSCPTALAADPLPELVMRKQMGLEIDKADAYWLIDEVVGDRRQIAHMREHRNQLLEELDREGNREARATARPGRGSYEGSHGELEVAREARQREYGNWTPKRD